MFENLRYGGMKKKLNGQIGVVKLQSLNEEQLER